LYLHFPLPEKTRGKESVNYLYLTFLLVFPALLTGVCNMIFSDLFLNSNINFETYRILGINAFSIAGFASALLF
jgi:hypothetical protein